MAAQRADWLEEQLAVNSVAWTDLHSVALLDVAKAGLTVVVLVKSMALTLVGRKAVVMVVLMGLGLAVEKVAMKVRYLAGLLA